MSWPILSGGSDAGGGDGGGGSSGGTTLIVSGADRDASFVVLALTASLPNERVLTAGTGITITDAGAGGAVTISADDAPDLTAEFVVVSHGQPPMDNERALVAGPGITITDTGAGGSLIISASAVSQGADAAASFIVVGATASLANERVLAAGTGISITDGGAGGNITISADGGELSVTGFAATIRPERPYIAHHTASMIGEFIVPSGTLSFAPHFGSIPSASHGVRLGVRVSGSLTDLFSFSSSLPPVLMAARTGSLTANPTVLELWMNTAGTGSAACLRFAQLRIT